MLTYTIDAEELAVTVRTDDRNAELQNVLDRLDETPGIAPEIIEGWSDAPLADFVAGATFHCPTAIDLGRLTEILDEFGGES